MLAPAPPYDPPCARPVAWGVAEYLNAPAEARARLRDAYARALRDGGGAHRGEAYTGALTTPNGARLHHELAAHLAREIELLGAAAEAGREARREAELEMRAADVEAVYAALEGGALASAPPRTPSPRELRHRRQAVPATCTT